MSKTITVEVPEELVEDLDRQANASGHSMSEYVSLNLARLLRKPDEKLRRHFGSVSLGKPLFNSNDELEQALSTEYGLNNQAPEPCS